MDQIEQNLSRIRDALKQRAHKGSEGGSFPSVEEPSTAGAGVFFSGNHDRSGVLERDDLIIPSQREHDNANSVTGIVDTTDADEADVWSLIRRRLGLGR
ncbi:MAG: hypothetical protein ACKO01_10230 [Erythrobacter sp.]